MNFESKFKSNHHFDDDDDAKLVQKKIQIQSDKKK